ncbi:hypothetical protein [Azospirillum halopraeferens]|uniref:hypothetical protein n=1 Tax=Azospirillum halopraeferens TaxID=34010 RepID=UPI0004129231|nr:hypothetical protein [Azospirillum halopraeferens]
MIQLKLTTTASAGLRPLGTPGQRSFELIVPTVQRALGTAHAQIFAEPVPAPLGDVTDWYAPLPGTARRLIDLDPDRQRAARDHLGHLAADIFAMADRLAGGADPESQRLAQALRNALEVPDETAIYVIGQQPVLTNWAHQQDVKEAPRGILSTMVPARRPPPPSPPPPPPGQPAAPVPVPPVPVLRHWTFWLWWLLVAVTGAILATIIWLLIAPCGLSGPAFLNTCPAPPEVSVIDPTLENRRVQIQSEIAMLERQALAAERACQPEPPPPPAPLPAAEPAPVAPPQDEIDERRERAGGQQGELTITLAWDSTADLDLHVRCPANQVIFFRNRAACSGGVLDVDANSDAGTRTRTPVENVFFGSGAAPGTYQISVHLFRDNGGRSHDFTVRVRMGAGTQDLRGTVSTRQPVWTHTIEYRE